MKLAAQFLSVLAAAGPADRRHGLGARDRGGKKAEKKEPNIFELIDADLKALDKAIFGPPKKEKK